MTGASAQAFVDIFLARPLADRPRRTGELTRWQAFGTLWRQEWQAPAPEDRRTHLAATVFTLLWHLVFGILLIWLMYVRFMEAEELAARRRGEEVVQVEFVGAGTPEEIGGGQARQVPQVRETPTPAPAQAAQADEAAPALATPTLESPAPVEPSVSAPVVQVEPREIPEPAPAPVPPVEQRVEVSAPTPDPSDFVLEAPTPRVAAPEVVARDVQAREATVQPTDIPDPARVSVRDLPQRDVEARPVQARVPDVAVRDVTGPVQQVRPAQVATPAAPQPSIRGPEVSVRSRDIPTPSTRPPAVAPASGTSQASATTPSPPGPAAPASTASSTAAAPASAAPSGPAAASSAAPPGSQPATTAGQGPRPVSAPGAFPTPARSDDWGASARDVPGGQRGEPSGLYDADGGPRLGESPVNTGQPPGTLDDRIVDLDRSGTWLKRKPVGYEPTTLDKYWRPHETLLAEWVRNGIKRMAIPIPGSNKKIECVVSILQLGGGCGISDPNLNDQPARARPPPDVPFKPHLQEDNGSVKPPPGG